MKKLLACLILCAGLAAGCATDTTTTTTDADADRDDSALTTTSTEQTTTTQPGRPVGVTIETSPGTASSPATTTTTDVAVTTDTTDVVDRPGGTADPQGQAYLDQLLRHQEEGLALAQEAVQQSEQTSVRSLAEDMVSEHESEIERVSSLRARLFGTVPTAQATGGNTTETRPNGVSAGANFDEAFLNEMLAHHKALLELSQDAQQSAQSSEVKSLAEDMVQDDQAEIRQLEQLLAAL